MLYKPSNGPRCCCCSHAVGERQIRVALLHSPLRRAAHTLNRSRHPTHQSTHMDPPSLSSVAEDAPPPPPPAAASAAPLPPAPLLPAQAGLSQAWGSCTTLYKLSCPLTNAPVCCASLCVCVGLATAGTLSRVDADGQPACERCGRRLSRVPHHRPFGAGRACVPRCKGEKRPLAVPGSGSSSSSASSAAALAPRKRSRVLAPAPGELEVQTGKRLRARPAKPVIPSKVQKGAEREAAALALLEVTHARRMLFLEEQRRQQTAAAESGTACAPPAAPSGSH